MAVCLTHYKCCNRVGRRTSFWAWLLILCLFCDQKPVFSQDKAKEGTPEESPYQEILSLGECEVVALSSDGKFAAVYKKAGICQVWEIPSKKLVHEWKLAERVTTLQFIKKSELLVLEKAPGRALELYRVATGELYGRLEPKEARSPGYFSYSEACDLFCTGSELWHLATLKSAAQIRVWGSIVGMAISEKDRVLAVSTQLRKIHLFKLPSLTPLGELDGYRARAIGVELWFLSFSPDLGGLFSYDNDWCTAWNPITREKTFDLYDFNWRTSADAVCLSGNGAILAFARDFSRLNPNKNTLELLETCSGATLAKVAGPKTTVKPVGSKRSVKALGFTGDSRALLYILNDGRIVRRSFLDDMSKPNPNKTVDPNHLFEELGGPAAQAYQAMCTLVNLRDYGVDLLAERMKPSASPLPERVRELIQQLDNESAEVRQAAHTELKRINDQAAPFLRAALKTKPTLELDRRITAILKPLDSWKFSASQLRSRRAIQVLEWIGNERAIALLKTLADGDANALQTIQAKLAVQRLMESQRSTP